MKSHCPLLIRLSFYCIASILMNGVSSAAVSVLGVMEHELDRSVKKLAQQPTPLYFLSYEITEEKSSYVRASFGTISASSDSERRLLDIDLRVGDYSLDNTHPIRERFGSGSRRFSQLEIPVSGIDALRNILWYQTDRKFKDAIERLTMVKANVQVKVKEEDRAADFSAEPPEQALEDPHSLSLDRSIWEDKLKQYTSPFSQSNHIYAADAALSASVVTRWYVNSEGSKIRTAESRARLTISALTKAEDGMELPRYESFFSFDLTGLPDDREVMEKVHAMIRDLEALRVAPIADPYTGPAILSGRASGVFFHEILGHRVEGHRQKSEQDSQTFKKMLGQRVLPETFTVVFDPTVRRIGPTDLAGSYRFDNQGVKAQRVAVIEDGTLKRFLMSRTPIDSFSQSNGHGRKQAGYAPVSRQSNLFVEVSKPHSREALKAMLIERLNAENKEFGLFFEDIQGGFTTTGRMLPNAFNVLPIMVYRIYADGREELVRGVDLIGTPLTTFSKVAAASDQIEVFNGTCGAESGGVPVSAASPAILVSQIEVQKKEKSIERLPLLPAPPGAPHSLRVAAEGGAR